MHPMLNIAIRAARSAGNVIIRSLPRIDHLAITTKGRNDFVSEVDRQAEQEIINIIHKAYPEHAIMAEESGQQGDDEIIWIIDPLDGTTNFLQGFPHYCVSIAVMVKGDIKHGVIYDPLRDELFTASRGSGAKLNDRRLRVTKAKDVQGSLLGTGFPFRCPQYAETYLAMFADMFNRVADMRRAGSAALDLAYVAAGRLDGYWEIGLEQWDIAAGILLVEESGGIISDFTGGDSYLQQGNLIVGNVAVHRGILNAITPYLTDNLIT